MTSYCSVSDVRSYTGIATQEYSDAGITTMIDGAQADIDRRTGRTWAGIATASNEYYKGDGRTILYLNRMDIIELTAIAIDENNVGTYTYVTPSTVKVLPEGILVLQESSEVSIFPTWDKGTRVSYTYAAATSSVPSDIQNLCVKMVASRLRHDPALDKDISQTIMNLAGIGTDMV